MRSDPTSSAATTVLEQFDPGPSPGRPSVDADPVRAGIAAMAPFVVGFAPFAFVIGSAAAASGSALAGWSGSWLIFGGSAQLAALRAGEVGVVAAVLTGLLIQARLLAYSASLAGRWRRQPRWFRLVAAAFVIDPTWAIMERRGSSEAGPGAERRFFLAAALTLGIGWSAMIAVGALVGDRLSTSSLQIAVPLCLVTVVGPRLRVPANRLPIVVAGAVALATTGLPAGVGVLCAVVAGGLAGALRPRLPASSEASR
jgi:predicted branched-subunit amino acid permease